MLFVKIGLVATLALIIYQDFKSKAVWWFLFPLHGIFGGFLFFNTVGKEYFFEQILVNLLLVGLMIGLLYLYATFVLKKSFLKEAIGLGDLFFFIAFALSFPTISFLSFFVFSLLFSIIISVFLKNRSGMKTLPLAGIMAIFLLGVYLYSWLGNIPNLYL